MGVHFEYEYLTIFSSLYCYLLWGIRHESVMEWNGKSVNEKIVIGYMLAEIFYMFCDWAQERTQHNMTLKRKKKLLVLEKNMIMNF